MREEFAVLMVFFGISVTANIGLLVSAIRSARRARRMEERLFETRQRPAGDDSDLLDGLAKRVDALARGQEFLGRLLTDRRRLRSRPDEPGIVTPH